MQTLPNADSNTTLLGSKATNNARLVCQGLNGLSTVCLPCLVAAAALALQVQSPLVLS